MTGGAAGDRAARLGRSTAIIGGVGGDDFGRCITERLVRDGVDIQCVEVFPHRSTGVAFVTYLADCSRQFIFHWDGTFAVLGRVPESEVIQEPRYFHLMGCSLMANEDFRGSLFEAVELFAATGAQITFDPNVRFELLKERTVEQIVGPTGSGDCFDAGFLCGLMKGRSPEDSARVVAAALNAQAFGPEEGKISPAAARELMETGETA